LAWTGVAKWGSQILTWGATLVVARLLLPEHYGIVGMATIYLGLVTVVNEFGFGAAIVSLRDLSDKEIAELNTVSVLFGIVSFALSFAAAGPLAAFFDTPELVPVVVVMSASFLIAAFRTVPQAVLQRELHFPRLAVIEGVQSILRALFMIVLAVGGMGYWTLVLGNVVGTLFWTALTLAVKRQSFAIPRWRDIGSAIRFSWHILGARIGWYVYSHADFAIAGRLLGKGPLGSYSLAWSTAGMPVEKVTALVGRVTPAIFSAVQNDKESLRRYLVLLTEGIALVTFPAAIGLALTADIFVPFVLGEQWRGAIVPLQLLALYATFRSIITLLPQILNVTGETRFGMWNAYLSAAVLPVGFLVGARWGTTGIAASWIFIHPLVTIPVYWRAFRRIELRAGAYLRALWPPASSVLLMSLVVLGAKRIEGESWHPALRLALEIGAGALSYGAALFAFHRGRVRAFRESLRHLR
jgi:PST family polysaccharide transporter